MAAMKHGPLDTNALHSFVTIAESNSFTDAAERLGVTQSAISQSLKQIETQLGVELVVRRKTPIKLTPAGAVLKKNADNILGQLRRLNAAVREAALKGVVQCRVGLVTSCSEVFGSQLIASLKDQTERLTLKSGLTPPLIEAFLNREIDVLISDEALINEEELERYEIFRDPMVLVRSSTLLGDKEALLPELAENASMIKYSRATSIGTYSEVVLRRMRIQASVRYETDDTHTLMNFVKDGHGWGILSGLCVAQTFYQLDSIRVMELDRSRHARTIYLLARKGELGEIPRQICEAAQQLFFDDIYPRLAEYAPWMESKIFRTGKTIGL